MFELKNITVSEKKIIFDNVDFEIDGSLLLYGESGIGKSTLLYMITGQHSKFTGTITYNGEDIYKMNNKKYTEFLKNDVYFMTQTPKLLENLTIKENMNMISNLTDIEIETELEKIGVNESIDTKLFNLSGGQRQRVYLIVAFLMQTKYVLLDEPTTSVDDDNFYKMLEYIKVKMATHHVIISTHDHRFLNNDITTCRIENRKIKCENEGSPLVLGSQKYKVAKISIFKIMKNNFKLQLNKIVLISVLLFTFIFILTNIFVLAEKDISNDAVGFSDDVIVMNYRDVIEPYIFEGKEFTAPSNQYNWSDEDVAKIESIDGVDEVYLGLNNMGMSADYRGYDGSYIYTSENYPSELLKYNSEYVMPDTIEVDIISVDANKEVYQHYKKGNVAELNIILGEYPDDYTNEILIPDFLAIEYAKLNEIDDIETLINSSIELNVNVDDPYATEPQFFVVSGIYETDYKNFVSPYYPIYTGYSIPNEQMTKELWTYDYYIDTVNYYENTLKSSDPIEYSYYIDNLVSYESALEFYATGMNQMIIILEKDANIEDVSHDIYEAFPNHIQQSNYVFENYTQVDNYQRLKLLELSYILIVAILLGFIIILVQRTNMKHYRDTTIYLSTIGYSKRNISLFLVKENLISGSIIIAIFYMLTFILSLFNFSMIYVMWQAMMTLSYVFFITLFILLILAINIVFILQFKMKKRRQYET